MNAKSMQFSNHKIVSTRDLMDNAESEGVNTGVSVFQFKIQLKHIGSPVWRRVLVPDDWTFSGLHEVIQAAFEWKDKRLHNFTFGSQLRIETENEIQAMSNNSRKMIIKSENMAEIAEVFSEFERGLYTYDFEENWEHEVVFERVLPKEPNKIYPCCVKARGQALDDDTYTNVPLDLEEINVRLAVLMPKYRKYIYRNPYEWRLYSCLSKQRLLTLRQLGKHHRTPKWSKLSKESLITALSADIIDSLRKFMLINDSQMPNSEQLLLFLLAMHKGEIPFEIERYQECFNSEKELFNIIDNLKLKGYIFDLAVLDEKQLPQVMQKKPEDFLPIIILPAEIRQKIIRLISEQDFKSIYRKAEADCKLW